MGFYMLPAFMHPSQVNELRILVPTNVAEPPEDDRALSCTVDCAYETRFLTDRHKSTMHIISGYCSCSLVWTP